MKSLSIITINYNNAEGLERTVESVINQTCKDFEYIVIDGGSADNSPQVIDKYKKHLDYSVSEKDAGIYNAMNKGLKLAHNDYIFFLNSGDVLADNYVIEQVMPLLTGEQIIYGNLLIDEGERKWQKQYPDALQFSHFVHDSLPHSGGSFFLAKGFDKELECYDESLKIVSDWKWFLVAIFKYNYSYKHINITTGVFDTSGVSSTNHALSDKEKQQVFEKEFKYLYKEITELLVYKMKYETLNSSRFLKAYLKAKIFFRL